MPGQGRLHGDARRLQVAHLADHDDVRVLADDGAQGPGEGHADGRLDLDLVDPGELVLHRVLHRDDLALLGVEARQGRVEGGGLAGTGGARDQEDAVGDIQHRQQPLPGRAVEAQGVEVEAHALLVQQAHDHALAEHGGDCGDAQIELLALDPQRDAPVLGQAPLGDVELGHDLDPGDDGRGGAYRGRVHLLQDAVHPIADLQLVGEGLDVDVRGAGVHRPLHDLVDHADDRGLARQVLEVLDVLLVELAALPLLLGGLGGRLLVEALDGGIDLRGKPDPDPHRLAQGQGQRLQEEALGGIGHRDVQAFCVFAQRQAYGCP